VLHIHRAERADGLVEALAALLGDPLADPFASEVVAVPTRGMERWLTQRVSARLGATGGRADGVCANVAFPSPRRLTGDAVAAASGIDPDTDPWLAERMVWPLLGVVEAALDEPWMRVLAAHLGHRTDASRRARRLSSIRHVAELFESYAVQRPAMLRAWADGRDTDAAGRDLPGDARWQPQLWRRLRDAIAAPDPAARLEHACARLRAEPGLADLPRRLSLFGLTRLPAATLQVLSALAEHRDVHVFALHPSAALWDRVAATTAGRTVTRRCDDPTRHAPRNRLLASWGQDARELQLVLGSAVAATADHHHAVQYAGATLLHRIQADVRADRAPDGERPQLAGGDRSIQVHACHGRSRQVEVLRGAILHELEQDRTLEPRDVVVMCPDIETFAPLIQATFGAGQVTDGEDRDALPRELRPPDLRVRLADRSLRQTNPVLGVAGALLDLAASRATASEVLDLADRAPVRRRFGFGDDDLARIEDWVSASGIRWGLDAAHRRPFKLDALGAGTWRAGLDRVLLGVTMSETLLGGVLALDDVESGAIDLAGRLAEFVDRLTATLDGLSVGQPVDAWAAAIVAGADALTATTPGDAWQRAELHRVLDDVVASATAAGGDVDVARLELPEVRGLLADRLAGRPTRANFRTGHLTVCTLMPMRSVPHRVVCLLGLDDGAFPRRSARDGDDLILDDPHVGDRDPRAEDRQLLLDALLAATDRLIVTYTGNDERTNVARPPAVPVGELLDAIDATVRGDGRPASERVVVRHPLQPFDPRDFVAVPHAGGRPWSFDRVTLEGARALCAEREQRPAFLSRPLPPDASPVVELDDLVRFVAHPTRAFLRQRLGIGVGDFSDEISDVLPVELGGLERWAVGQRLLEALLAGTPAEEAVAVEIARGTLPPGRLAAPVVRDVRRIAEQIAAQVRVLCGEGFEPASVDVDVAMRDGRRLSGTVAGVGDSVVRAVSFSRVNPGARLAAWVRLLALTAADPQSPREAVTIGRARLEAERATVTIARIAALEPHGNERERANRALEHLATLADLRDRGLREPLPLACLASAAYARAARDGRDGARAARAKWASGFRPDGEDEQREHRLVFGGALPFDALLAEPPRDDEAGAGWDASEPTRFGRYARRLWEPLLADEDVSDR
jgi:exodeoxyribonuclease V gamma subunit